MALEILSSPAPDPEHLAEQLHDAIEAEIPAATVRVTPSGVGHFEILVVSPAFEGKTRVAQQQMVYRAISEFMSGGEPPVHAVDRMETRAS